jgi:ferrous iron transport protein B
VGRRTQGCHGEGATVALEEPTRAAAAPVVASGGGADGGAATAVAGGAVTTPHPAPPARPRVVLVGAPNVGKSALFNRLTGAYVTVSNYPGTSVQVDRGRGTLGGVAVEVIDTPGLYSLLPTTEEERVTRQVLLAGHADVLVHVVDAKNLPRMLALTLQLLELGRPLVLAVNMVDEAERLGIELDAALLAERLGVPAVPIVAVQGRGVAALGAAVAALLPGEGGRDGGSAGQAGHAGHAGHAARAGAAGRHGARRAHGYANGMGEAVAGIRARLGGVYPVDATAVAALLLQGDDEVAALVRAAEADGGAGAEGAAAAVAATLPGPASYRVAVERQKRVAELLDGVLASPRAGRRWGERLGRALANPLTGIPVLLLVLYLGLFKFVGQFGGGFLVDWIEEAVFEERLNPLMETLFAPLAWGWLRDLFVGEYGVLTLGLRYAVAIVLPIVGTFFLFFSIVEDSGYFPRLALLVDRLFKRIGMNGRAVIPMVLGFACDTMATMVTRTLETRRERVLATLLLALAIPCSAQLGVILAILAAQPLALGVWAVALAGTFLLVGWLGSKVLPGEAATFHMELPPLRLPRAGNVLTKTYSRMQWYFLEVLPLFIVASVLLWAGNLTGLLQAAIRGLAPLVQLLGLPVETATVFLIGFFRRDYGAAGLFDLNQAGLLDPVQLAVAAVTLTLFVPCIAQFLMMIRERGLKTALGMVAFITPFAFGMGALVNVVLRWVLG